MDAAQPQPPAGGDLTLKQLQQIFERYDANGNRTISKDELRKVLQALDRTSWTERKVDRLFRAIDVKRDGRIDYDEFVRWLSAGATPDERRQILGRSESTPCSSTAADAEGLEGKLDAFIFENARLHRELDQMREALFSSVSHAQVGGAQFHGGKLRGGPRGAGATATRRDSGVDLGALQQLVQRKNEHIRQRECHIQELLEERRGLKSNLLDKQRALADLDAQLKGGVDRSRDLDAALAEERQLRRAGAEAAQRSSEELSAARDAAQARAAELEASLVTAEAAAREAAERAAARAAGLEARLAEQASELEGRLAAERRRAGEEATSLQAKVLGREASRDLARRDAEALSAQLAELGAQLRTLEAELAKRQGQHALEAAELHGCVSELEHVAEAASARAEDLSQELRASQEREEDLQSQLGQSQWQAAQRKMIDDEAAEKELERVRGELVQWRGAAQDAVAQMKSFIAGGTIRVQVMIPVVQVDTHHIRGGVDMDRLTGMLKSQVLPGFARLWSISSSKEEMDRDLEEAVDSLLKKVKGSIDKIDKEGER